MLGPKCPLTEEWIKKMWYLHTMEYYSAIKKNKIMLFAATQMDLEIIILSEWYKSEKDKSHYHLYWNHDWATEPNWYWNEKNDTNELIYKTETDSQTLRTNSWLPGGKGRGEE